MAGYLTTLQTQCVTIMEADARIDGVSILYEQIGNIGSMIQAALSKIGICAIVLTPGAEGKGTAPGPQVNPVKLTVQITELVFKNRSAAGTNIPASSLAEHLAWLLHYANHAATRSDPQLTFRRLALVPDKNYLIYNVDFETASCFEPLPDAD
jgi:hypothetical protein